MHKQEQIRRKFWVTEYHITTGRKRIIWFCFIQCLEEGNSETTLESRLELKQTNKTEQKPLKASEIVW